MIESRLWLEHFSINHNGIKVDVLVDYKQMHVSIVDHDRSKKNYMFCERWLRYQNSWKEILKAIEIWMDEWFRRLQERHDADTESSIHQLALASDELKYAG